MKQFPRSRSADRLSDSVLRQLDGYALAATAAGVGVLALAQSAEGKIVYTPAHTVVPFNRTIPIDLNHDGIHDFGIVNETHNTTSPFGDFLGASPLNSGNGIWVVATSRRFDNYAAALRAGVRIGPASTTAKRFQPGPDTMVSVDTSVNRGPWANVCARYLGLQFLIKGKIHYGWARLNVSVANDAITATLTGYAYETVPGKPIIAGKTKGNSTLGQLAMGK